jgi:hypothetical protein
VTTVSAPASGYFFVKPLKPFGGETDSSRRNT